MKAMRCANVLILCMVLVACNGLTVQQKVDTGIQIAQQIYVLADAYYQINRSGMTPENQVLFDKYLAGFRLAIQTGEGLAGYAMRWFQFQSGY